MPYEQLPQAPREAKVQVTVKLRGGPAFVNVLIPGTSRSKADEKSEVLNALEAAAARIRHEMER